MAHPVHDVLRRILGTEQFAFDAGTRQYWPWDREPRFSVVAAQPGEDEEPTRFDDIDPWLEPQN